MNLKKVVALDGTMKLSSSTSGALSDSKQEPWAATPYRDLQEQIEKFFLIRWIKEHMMFIM